MHLIPRYV